MLDHRLPIRDEAFIRNGKRHNPVMSEVTIPESLRGFNLLVTPLYSEAVVGYGCARYALDALPPDPFLRDYGAIQGDCLGYPVLSREADVIGPREGVVDGLAKRRKGPATPLRGAAHEYRRLRTEQLHAEHAVQCRRFREDHRKKIAHICRRRFFRYPLSS